MTEVPYEYALLRAIAECDVKPSVRLFQIRLGFSAGTISKCMSLLRKHGALAGESYVVSERETCMLHEWFPQSYPEPDSCKLIADQSCTEVLQDEAVSSYKPH